MEFWVCEYYGRELRTCENENVLKQENICVLQILFQAYKSACMMPLQTQVVCYTCREGRKLWRLQGNKVTKSTGHEAVIHVYTMRDIEISRSWELCSCVRLPVHRK